ncbi:glycoside hydrolase domain-containing protein [Streptomyces sp. HD]|uniref:glycoside hydrolase domain-containing protein n=1 Tax=Streptomyces sp. HD TaxID=3020892 RepID=UPI00232C36FC|nr:glycoside hydrolase domain-containing protein [Streptomyces sp. HD]MDC0771745.1 DUF1906 domain-containing protein [Streptomyces sp. HD]
MGEVTWTGQDGTFHWNAAKNWSPSVPTAEDDIVIPDRTPWNIPSVAPGTRVRSVRLEGGGLQGRLQVATHFTWLGGRVRNGVELGAAQLILRGEGPLIEMVGGVVTSAYTSIDGAEINVSEGMQLVNTGQLTTVGVCRFVWIAGMRCFLINRGVLSVTSGKLTLHDMVTELSHSTLIEPGAVISTERGGWLVLHQGAEVSGGGRLTVGTGLYAVSSAKVAAGTTLEMGPGTHLSAKPPPGLPSGVVPGTQLLVVEGVLEWTGGTVEGNVRLGKKAVLNAHGPQPLSHTGGLVTLTGSGVIAGPGLLQGHIARLRNEGDLLLKGPLTISRGNGYLIENTGTLRIDAGGGEVRDEGNGISNTGQFTIERGTLRLGSDSQRLKFFAPGTLRVYEGAILRVDQPLVVSGGALTGRGRLVAAVGVQGKTKVIPGESAKPGTITVEGNCSLGTDTELHIAVNGTIPGTGHSRLLASGQVTVGGRLVVDTASTYVPALGEDIEIVSGGTNTVVEGRFASASIPQRASGVPFWRVVYRGAGVHLVGSQITLGLDMQHPPADAKLKKFVAASPYRWIGYYLQAPCHNGSWNGKRAFLESLGLGILVIYAGRQTVGMSNCSVNDTTPTRGRTDAQDATTRAAAQGFTLGSWVYLDVEGNTGSAPDPQIIGYVQAWVGEMLRLGSFQPGLYIHQKEAQPLHDAAMRAFTAHGRTDRPRYWVVGGPKVVDPAQAPARSGVPEAVAWQQKIDYAETRAGITLTIDRSVSVLPAPSTP